MVCSRLLVYKKKGKKISSLRASGKSHSRLVSFYFSTLSLRSVFYSNINLAKEMALECIKILEQWYLKRNVVGFVLPQPNLLLNL